MTNHIIFAAGGQRRWGRRDPKQLAGFHGTTLIGRTMEFIRKLATPIVATAHPQIAKYARLKGCVVVEPERRRQLVETLDSMREYWGQTTIAYLGDVYYTEDAFQTIQDVYDLPAFFGNNGDIFAFKFHYPSSQLDHSIQKVMMRIDQDPIKWGWFWHLYRAMGGMDLDVHHIRDCPGELRYIMIEDETDDIDFYQDYIHLLRQINE